MLHKSSSTLRRGAPVCAMAIASGVFTPHAARAQGSTTAESRPERIVGSVRTDSGAALPAVEVIATRGPDRAIQRDTTRPDGRFEIRWTEGTGDYLLYVAAPGRRPFRQRLQRASAADSVFTVDVRLPLAVTRLAVVAVTERRQKPQREREAGGPGTGAAEWDAGGRPGLLAPDRTGELAAVAATVPGVSAVPGGFSVLGLGADQNQATLDGLAFGGGSVPREARLSTRVASSAYDPARGGFSGAQVALDFWTGSLFAQRNGSISLDAPALQVADPAARALGERFTNVRASVGADGPWGRTDAYRYNVAAQLSRRTSDLVSLLDASPRALQAAGVAVDSVQRLARVLETLGVPVRTDASAVQRHEELTLLGRFDRTGFDWNASAQRPRSGALTTYARLWRASPVGVGVTDVATRGGLNDGLTLAVQGLYSAYFGRAQDRLTELRSGVTLQRERRTPLLAIPAATVRVGTGSRDADDAALAVLGFGAHPSFGGDQRQWTWETLSETQWYASPAHRLKLALQSRLDAFTAEPAASRFGQYDFLSLDDLAAGRAARFTRSVAVPSRSGAMWSGVAALGDNWRPHPRLDVVYGARVEGNRFLTAPQTNPQLTESFGVRNDAVPQRLRVSPRLGFTWRYSRPRAPAAASPLPTFGLPLARPAATLRGGIGEFRSLLLPQLVGDPRAMTGLADAVSQIQCVGDAVPVPDWRAFAANSASLPATCRSTGGSQSAQAESARPVTLVDPGFDAPRSWRGNLAWNTRWRRVAVSVDGIVSYNRHQPGTVDLNLRRHPVAVLPAERGRAVYVPLTAFVPGTGAVAPTLARIDDLYGRVTSLRSDLRSTSRQLTIALAPELRGGSSVTAAYTLGSMRIERRGFDGAAFGELWVRETARGDLDARHQLLVTARRPVPWLGGTTVSLLGLVRSGLPYTPLVAGDLNGDGRSNDRAFIHDPTAAQAAGDPGLAGGMRALLASAPAHARRCLAAQLGEPAGRNSCEGPWATTMNARLDLPWRFVPVGVGNRRRVGVGLNLSNPLGGLDQLLHGAAGLRGWGAPALPEQTLYAVTGFDAASRRFRYVVNPRFGATSPARSTTRAPFRVTLDVTVDLARPLEVQQVDRFLAPGRSRPGPRLDSAALKARYSRNVPNVYQAVLRHADSLFLSRAQIETLQGEERAYLARLDSLWGRMAGEFARLPAQFDAQDALRAQEAYVDRAWEVNRTGAQRIRALLTPEQFALSSSMVRYLATEQGPIRTRIFFSG